MPYNSIGFFNPEQSFVFQNICYDPMNGSGSTGDISNINYMGFVSFVTPSTFLKCAAAMPSGAPRPSLKFFEERFSKKDLCVSPPSLTFQQLNDNHWTVIGHEGRHRTTAMQRLGVNLVPVYCFLPGIRSRNITMEMINQLLDVSPENKGPHITVKFQPQFLILQQQVFALDSANWESNKPQIIGTKILSKDNKRWSIPV